VLRVLREIKDFKDQLVLLETQDHLVLLDSRDNQETME